MFLILIAFCQKETPVSFQPVSPSSYVTFSADNEDVKNIVASVSEDSLRSYVEKLAGFYTRHTNSDTISNERGIGVARRWIFSKFKEMSTNSGGRFEVFYDHFSATIRGVPGLHQNVIARLPGTISPEQQILVSGHYDSRTIDNSNVTGSAPGANDDGSGVAGVIELARILSNFEFTSTIVFIAFTGEEQGLYGSRHYAQMAKQRGDNIIAVLNNDMIGNIVGGSGNIDSSRVRCFSDEPMESPHRQLARYIKLQGEAYVNNLLVDLILAKDRPGRGGDHLAFYEQNYTAVRLTEPEDNLNHQHNDNDLPQYMSFNYHRKIVQMNAAVIASLAWAPLSPISLSAKTLQKGKYQLHWKTSDTTQNINYLIALRPNHFITTDSLLDVGTKVEIELDNVKSSTLVSVAAKGEDNNESLFSLEVLIGNK